MSITSFSYFVLIGIGTLMYYILPKKIQWVVLLLLSVVFYYFAATPYTFVYVIISSLMAWGVTNGLERFRSKNGEFSDNDFWKTLIVLSIVIDIILWFILKGKSFITSAIGVVRVFVPKTSDVQIPELVAALGMGYYTLQVIGYELDCYWGNATPQKNYLKLLLFTCFFPQMVTGPISRYDQLQDLYKTHSFSYTNLAHGTQRILWGLLKKIVLAERCGVIVNAVWADPLRHHGLYIWIAFLLYPIQMYSDFSGCMDIVIGVSEIFGIKLTENFNNPFFSKTSQEFWQRWHISLGNWAKDYVLYPVLKSNWMIKLGKNLRNKMGKKNGKFLATFIGMFILWMVMGIWHGAFKYVIGVSLWYWIILMLGDFTRPYTDKLVVRCGFKTETLGWRLFQCTRTYLIYAVGSAFFRAKDIVEALDFFKALFSTFSKKNWNPWILFDGSLATMGLSYKDINVVLLSVVLLLLVAILRERYGYARNWIDKQPFVLRWGIYICLLLAVVVWGSYGPGYESSAFIYGQF